MALLDKDRGLPYRLGALHSPTSTGFTNYRIPCFGDSAVIKLHYEPCDAGGDNIDRLWVWADLSSQQLPALFLPCMYRVRSLPQVRNSCLFAFHCLIAVSFVASPFLDYPEVPNILGTARSRALPETLTSPLMASSHLILFWAISDEAIKPCGLATRRSMFQFRREKSEPTETETRYNLPSTYCPWILGGAISRSFTWIQIPSSGMYPPTFKTLFVFCDCPNNERWSDERQY